MIKKKQSFLSQGGQDPGVYKPCGIAWSLNSTCLKPLQKISQLAHKVGRGGYADVYRGVYNGEEIAVKRLRQGPGLVGDAFVDECRKLSKVRHQNVVQLIGYCYESRNENMEAERVLCFEYMQGGSLNAHISDESCGLDWPTRFKIIKAVCEGLNHLQEIPISHLDLKPANILLDNNMTAKIADLGLPRIVASTETEFVDEVCAFKGDLGSKDIEYIPPEYIDDRIISKEFDVFSLGVVIIKIMAGDMGHICYYQMSEERFIKLITENWKKRLQGMWRYSSQKNRHPPSEDMY